MTAKVTWPETAGNRKHTPVPKVGTRSGKSREEGARQVEAQPEPEEPAEEHTASATWGNINLVGEEMISGTHEVHMIVHGRKDHG